MVYILTLFVMAFVLSVVNMIYQLLECIGTPLFIMAPVVLFSLIAGFAIFSMPLRKENKPL